MPLDLGVRRRRGDPGLRLGERVLGLVDGDEPDAWAGGDELHGLGADSAADLEHPRAGRVRRTGVQETGQCFRLVGQPPGLVRGVAVYVVSSHTSKFGAEWSGEQVQSERDW